MSKFELDDVEVDVGMSEDDIEELMESGDEDAIAKALGWNDDSTDDDGDEFGTPDGEETLDPEDGEEPEGKEGDTDGTPPDAGQKDDNQPEGEEGRFVESRDGKHKIPYQVLQAARDRANQLEQQARELESQFTGTKSELEQARELNEKLKAQLQENDLTPADVLQKADIDDETLETLSEYGDIGEVVRALVMQNKQLMESMPGQGAQPQHEPQQQVDPVQQQVETAITENADLNSWRESDPDRWEMAKIIDNQLMADPAFKDASFADRFAEAAKRTRAAFGDADQAGESLKDRAAKAVETATKNQHPQSLTDVGRQATTMKSKTEIFSEMNEAELAAAMEGMSQDQVDELLANL